MTLFNPEPSSVQPPWQRRIIADVEEGLTVIGVIPTRDELGYWLVKIGYPATQAIWALDREFTRRVLRYLQTPGAVA